MEIITNNKQVLNTFEKKFKIHYLENGTFLEVLLLARDKIHTGGVLVTHPLSGSIKPNQTPYKSIIVKNDICETDCQSVIMIENAINTYYKFQTCSKTPNWTEKVKKDFATVDLSIVNGALQHVSLDSKL